LVEAVARGELDALGELFKRHAARVRRIVRRLGVPAHECDDFVQSTFLELHRAAPRFERQAPVGPFIIGLAVVLARRRRRNAARIAEKLVSWLRMSLAGQIEPRSPAEQLEEYQSVSRLLAAIAELSPKKREAFVLVALEDMSGEDAAKALGVPINTVWTRLHHARRELRAALVEEAP